jgi:predicted P-loop ATPase
MTDKLDYDTPGVDPELAAERVTPFELNWKADLLLTATKQPRPVIANALAALRGASDWAGVLAYDEFSLVTMAMRPPVWLQRSNEAWAPRPWSDTDDVHATEWLQRQGILVPVAVAARAVETVAHDAAFHPIRDWLNGLKWDKKERVGLFAVNYLGAEDTSYYTAVSRSLFVGAVARVSKPGCKLDHVPVFEGGQGVGKSTAVKLLFSPWFSDDIAELGTKDAAMQVRAAWGIEISELAAMTRGEIERVKAFITRSTDTFRPPFQARVIAAPRQSVFVGTTNAAKWIKDETGGRRFWPIRCGTINTQAIERDREQLWAEAVQLYRSGCQWWLDELETECAKLEQDDRRVDDAWEGPIEVFIEGKRGVNVGQILEEVFKIEKSKWTKQDQTRIGQCLAALGWKPGRQRSRRTGKVERCYRPSGASNDA